MMIAVWIILTLVLVAVIVGITAAFAMPSDKKRQKLSLESPREERKPRRHTLAGTVLAVKSNGDYVYEDGAASLRIGNVSRDATLDTATATLPDMHRATLERTVLFDLPSGEARGIATMDEHGMAGDVLPVALGVETRTFLRAMHDVKQNRWYVMNANRAWTPATDLPSEDIVQLHVSADGMYGVCTGGDGGNESYVKTNDMWTRSLLVEGISAAEGSDNAIYVLDTVGQFYRINAHGLHKISTLKTTGSSDNERWWVRIDRDEKYAMLCSRDGLAVVNLENGRRCHSSSSVIPKDVSSVDWDGETLYVGHGREVELIPLRV